MGPIARMVYKSSSVVQDLKNMVHERSRVVIIGYMKTYESEMRTLNYKICVSEWKKKENIANLKLNNVRFGSLL
jgi:hypothetical protein